MHVGWHFRLQESNIFETQNQSENLRQIYFETFVALYVVCYECFSFLLTLYTQLSNSWMLIGYLRGLGIRLGAKNFLYRNPFLDCWTDFKSLINYQRGVSNGLWGSIKSKLVKVNKTPPPVYLEI